MSNAEREWQRSAMELISAQHHDVMRVLRDNNQMVTTSLDRVSNQIADLAVQVGNQAQSIDRLEKAINALAEESRQNNETAKLQAQNVAELIRTVRELAIARG